MKYAASNIKIVGMSAAVPAQVVDNTELAVGDKNRQRLIKMIGVYRRHIIDLNKNRLVDFAITASKDVIEQSGINKDDIKFIVYITQKPEFGGPATAFYIQKHLGIGIDCMVFDINLGCSGFMAGLQVVSSLLQGCADGKMALLINAENLSSIPRENPNDELIFGDGATAVLIKKDDNSSFVFMEDYYSDGNRYDTILQRELGGPCVMDGQVVFEFSVYEVSKYISSFMEENNLTDENIDHIAFHQAQKFIIDHVVAKATLDKNKILYSLDEYGNTSSASIPLTICKNSGVLCDHGKYLLSGFGVGLAWGIGYIDIDRDVVYGIKEI